MILSRETTVGCITALLLTFTAWTWGGVVAWTQFATAALGLLALGLAVLPARAESRLPHPGLRALLGSFLLGLAVAAAWVVYDLLQVIRTRDATLQLLPDAQLPSLAFSEWGLSGCLVGLFVSLLTLLILGLVRSPQPRSRLLRFPFFWLGLFLFAWIACQSWNTWGVVVHRDLGWLIVPREHIAWLPSGLAAPFASDEPPGGMNGWRQLLILVGPWALLCALHAAALPRRHYAWIAGAIIINSLCLPLLGLVSMAEEWKSFLGYEVPDITGIPFGPFVYRNQAGAYLYVSAALASALALYLAIRRGDNADRGGPHLIVFLAAIFLAIGSAATLSFLSAAAAALVVIVLILAFCMDSELRRNMAPGPFLAILALTGVVVYAALASVDAKKWRWKLEKKIQRAEQVGEDDRAPLRRVSLQMLSSPTADRELSGWGGGSYRWVSPPYMAAEAAFVDGKGALVYRATHAHNDWLQSLVEWGMAGAVVCLFALLFLLVRLRHAVARPRAPTIMLLGGLILFAAHAFLDFLLFIPQLTLLAVLIAWLLALESSEDSPAR